MSQIQDVWPVYRNYSTYSVAWLYGEKCLCVPNDVITDFDYDSNCLLYTILIKVPETHFQIISDFHSTT